MNHFIKMTGLVMTLCGYASSAPADLSGQWKLMLDQGDGGVTASPACLNFTDSIHLPNTLTLAGKGQPLALAPELGKASLVNLHQRFSFVGPAWYQRDIEVPGDWSDRDVQLELERVLWESRLWVNGTEAGMRDSLSTPHRYELGRLLRPGRNTLTLRIDNREKLPIGIGHAYTNATQTIWNGVAGKMTITAVSRLRVDTLRLRPEVGGNLKITLGMLNSSGKPLAARLAVRVLHPDGGVISETAKSLDAISGESTDSFTVSLGGAPVEWSEFDPRKYTVEVTLESAAGTSVIRDSFGYRLFKAEGRHLLVNDRQVFLRGTLECCIFPKTGHPDMVGNEWEKIFTTAKAHGLNHLRFHSWCPPKVAFETADKHGFYLQVELPNWSFKMGQLPAVDAFFQSEGERILREYGNHPSFVLFSLGNELTGDLAAMDRMLGHLKAIDPDKLYTSTSFAFSPRGQAAGPADDFFISQQTSSGWVRGQGFLNQTAPNTLSDYSPGLSSVAVPLVTHEVGQYNNYPNLAELPKYEGGALRALGYEAIRDDLLRKGRLGDAARYTRDSGKLAALLYKEDVERALRTKDQAGIQLLDLHDFPGQSTATVGILDAFWDSKGLIEPARFREFFGPTVPLARMAKMTWANSETFMADLEIAHFGKQALTHVIVEWSLRDETGAVKAKGSIPVAEITLGNGVALGQITAPLAGVTTASQLTLHVAIAGTDIRNSWPVWVYPNDQAVSSPSIEIVKTGGPRLAEALEAGKRVLVLPDRASVAHPLDARFIPVFWSPLHFPDQPGTLGATIDNRHPVFAAFPTDTHTNWQWWELLATSFAMDLDHLTTKPVMPLCFVDKFDRNALPAAIWEAKVGAGRLLVCTLDIDSNLTRRIAARQLRRSILAYMASPLFAPERELSVEVVNSLFRTTPIAPAAESPSGLNADARDLGIVPGFNDGAK
ncbi:MAG: Beta-galactosidase [Verrucomicrobiota bacterium]